MSVRFVTCILVNCDGCDDPSPDEEQGPWHWENIDDARKSLPSYGWLVSGDRFTCGDCAERAACALLDHAWEPWRDLIAEPRRQGGDPLPFRLRSCGNCSQTEHDPPLPAKQPVSKGGR